MFTLTLEERAESGPWMEKRGGEMATTGISVEQLRRIHKMYPASELVDLSKLSAEHVPEAAVLVLRGGVGLLLDDPEGALKVRREVKSMPTDKEKRREQTVIPCKSYTAEDVLAELGNAAPATAGPAEVEIFSVINMPGLRGYGRRDPTA